MMRSAMVPKRLLAAAIALAFLGLILAGVRAVPSSAGKEAAVSADQTRTYAVPGAGWPMYGGSPQRNMVNFERNIADDFSIERKDFKGKILSQAKNLKWQAALGSRAYGGPVVAGGKIYVGTNNHYPRGPIRGDKGIVMCFRESDGQFLWQAVHDKLPRGTVNDYPNEGIVSTPVVEGNRVYYVSNRCELICADANGLADGNDGVQDEQYQGPFDADVIWRLDMMTALGVFPHSLAACSPLIHGDLVFAVTGNGVDANHVDVPKPEAPSFVAVNKSTGQVAWQSNLPGRNIMHGQWSNPVLGVVDGQPQVVFPGGDGWLYAFASKTGKLIWKFDANPKAANRDRSDFIATPVIVGSRLYIGTGQSPEHFVGIGHLWCINIHEATAKGGDVSADLVANANPVVVKPNPNSAVVWHYGGVFSKKDAAKFGRDYPFGRTMSTVAVKDGLVYAADLDGIVHCLDAENGKPLWEHDLKAPPWGSALWVDGKVYIGTEDGDVWIFAHGRWKKDPRRIEFGQPICSTPVVANGVLYIMSESHLYAIGK